LVQPVGRDALVATHVGADEGRRDFGERRREGGQARAGALFRRLGQDAPDRGPRRAPARPLLQDDRRKLPPIISLFNFGYSLSPMRRHRDDWFGAAAAPSY
jgi:hypothetical protein